MKFLSNILFPHPLSQRGMFLLLLSFAMGLALNSWMVMINNFSIEMINFNGADIGLLQSVREIPGFLAFLAVYLLLFFTEQRLAMIFLLMLAVGTLITGLLPSYGGILFSTLVMSIGFHYYETYSQSLSMQWISRDKLPGFLGSMAAVRSFAALIAYGGISLMMGWYDWDYHIVYGIYGGAAFLITVYAFWKFPTFTNTVEQHKKFLLRKRYGLFYALTFFSGARRQIFVVFAGFLMVERFGFAIEEIALLFLGNHFLNMFLAPMFGRFIAYAGERTALVIEYIGLIAIFLCYAVVDDANVAIVLYVLDHMFFSLSLAIKSYFQKIADPKDLAASAAVSFTINHIAAVVLPVVFGLVWLSSPALVFYTAATLAGFSLVLAFMVPRHPEKDREIIFPIFLHRR